MTDKRRATGHENGLNEAVNQDRDAASPAKSAFYEILVEGHLDDHWSAWLGGLEITHDSKGYTLLSGVIPDQATLHGILVHIRDLGLQLIALKRLENRDARGRGCAGPVSGGIEHGLSPPEEPLKSRILNRLLSLTMGGSEL